jgi:DNA primase
MDAVEEIKQRLNIEDVVGEYVELKRAGRNWKGLSPFGAEKTPSFIVSPEKQIWHDFSSGKGGNVFSFVMEMEGLDFKGALELLARKAGIDLEQFRRPGQIHRGQEKERVYEALELAAKFYQVQFSRNQAALEYVFKKRQFTKETALEWRLGYSPNNGSALCDFLKNKGFKETEIKAAGLNARAYRGGTQDMFRGRIMIPLADAQGRIIGFTARLLQDDPNAPKYINTPQTILYDKSRHVYGLHLAKEAIRRSKFVVLVEGNLDVIASHQAGVRQVVATAGTAMTEQHLKALSRFTGDIRLCFDADKAGINATERAIPIASKVGVSLEIITIPSGKDPDELIKQNAATWTEIIGKPQYALDWLMDRYKKVLDLSGAQGKRQFSDVILAVVRGLQDGVEQEHYIEKIAHEIGVTKAALLDKLQKVEQASKPRLKQPRAAPQLPDKTVLDRIKVQNRTLAIALMQPRLRFLLAPFTTEMFVEDQAKAMLEFLQEHPDFVGGNSEPPAALRPLAEYSKIIALEYEELYQGLELPELQEEGARLQAHLIEQYVKMQKQRLAHELHTADDARTTVLLKQAKQLDQLLKTHKGGA